MYAKFSIDGFPPLFVDINDGLFQEVSGLFENIC
jgi:hypothetical protein